MSVDSSPFSFFNYLAIQVFCGGTAIALTLDYLFQLFLFCPMMHLSARFETHHSSLSIEGNRINDDGPGHHQMTRLDKTAEEKNNTENNEEVNNNEEKRTHHNGPPAAHIVSSSRKMHLAVSDQQKKALHKLKVSKFRQKSFFIMLWSNTVA